MSGLTCNSCNKEFEDDTDQKHHYKSEWHRYNLKRKIAGVPGVTESLFEARQAAIAQEKTKSAEAAAMLYSCGICDKSYRSSKAHEQHLKSRSHVLKASQGTNNGEQDIAIIRQLPPRKIETKSVQLKGSIDEESEESEDEWTEVDSDDDLAAEASDMDEDETEYELDPSCCFMCDRKQKTIEKCMVHMHKYHGFFIPDIEYLKDPEGFLTYLGLKVKRDFMCLYCNELCHAFSSLEAVRKHMEAKSHCKVHYGDNGDDEDAELEEFYDYSSSYEKEGKDNQMVVSGESDSTIELFGGSELVITKRIENKTISRTLGSREFMRYYKQKPPPSSQNDKNIVNSLAYRYKRMGLATVQSKEEIVRMKVIREMNKRGEKMRNKLGMKSNVIRNLPKNCTY